MATETIARLELNLPKQHFLDGPQSPKTPAEWFSLKFPDAVRRFGCPFLEMRQSSIDGFLKITPVSINHDFFAAMLGGDSSLGHSVVYFEAEMQWYFRDRDGVYKPTSPEKLQNYYRAMMLRCGQELGGEVDKLNLFQEFRSDRISKAVVQRAKSVLAASPEFFSATSPHTRIKGIELHERLARKFVEELLCLESGQVLLLADAYAHFVKLLKQQNLDVIKRPEFKAMVTPIIQDEFAVGLRNDLVVDGKSGIRGWKNVRLVQSVPT